MALHRQLVRAYFDLIPERYDYQLSLVDFDTYVEEEISIYSCDPGLEVEVAPLPPRNAHLQLNMRATDQEGNNLVLLSKEELAGAHADLLIDAQPFIEAVGAVPLGLAELIRDDNLRETLLDPDWPEEMEEQGETEEILRFVTRAYNELPPELEDEQEAFVVFADFIVRKLTGKYRPWVRLNTPIRESEDGAPAKVMVKYESEKTDSTSSSPFASAVLGYTELDWDISLASECSNHVRIRPPTSMALGPPMTAELSGEPFDQRPGHREIVPKHDQVQAYLSAEEARERTEDEGASPTLELEMEVTQLPSMRVLATALFAAVGIFPWFFVSGSSLVVPWSESATLGVFAADQVIQANDVAAATSTSLSIALALVALGWDSSGPRAFAVAQLLLSMAVVAVWFLASWGFWFLAYLATGGAIGMAVVNLWRVRFLSEPDDGNA